MRRLQALRIVAIFMIPVFALVLTLIAGPAAAAEPEPTLIAESKGKLYAVKASDGTVWELASTGKSWIKVGVGAKAIVANGGSLYKIATSPPDSVWQYQGSPYQWIHIGDRAKMLAADGNQLYVLSTGPENTIWQYNGQPNSWNLIGGDAAMIAAGAGRLYTNNINNHSLWLWKGSTALGWSGIGSSVGFVAAGVQRAYVVNSDNASFWEVDINPAGAKYLGSSARMVAVTGTTREAQRVYSASAVDGSVWEINPNANPPSATKIISGGIAKSITVAGNVLYYIAQANNSIWKYAPGTPGRTGSWVILPNFPDSSVDYSLQLAQQFAPLLHFDQRQGESDKCFPSDAGSYYTKRKGGDGGRVCNTDYNSIDNGNVPIYYLYKQCGDGVEYLMYWFFYGYQDTCSPGLGAHDADWERIVVKVINGGLDRVLYYQHSGSYTRASGNYEIQQGTHPAVYVGKNSHGSYHDNGGSGTCCYWEDFRNPGSPNRSMWTWKNLVALSTDVGSPEWMNDNSFAWGKGADGDIKGPLARGDDLCRLSGCQGYGLSQVCTTNGCFKSDLKSSSSF